jgi:hypothetical protein
VRIRKEDAKIRKESNGDVKIRKEGDGDAENNGEAKIRKDVKIRKERDGEDARTRKEEGDGDGVVDVARSGGTVTVLSSSACNNKHFALWKLVIRRKFKTPVLFFKNN